MLELIFIGICFLLFVAVLIAGCFWRNCYEDEAYQKHLLEKEIRRLNSIISDLKQGE